MKPLVPPESPLDIPETNQDIEAARAYHEATKLSYINLRHKPPLYKSYSGFPVIPLPKDIPLPEVPAPDAVSVLGDQEHGTLDLHGLARLLYYSAGVIRVSNLPTAGEVHYRAASSAGALYPIETYVVCGDVAGLDAGVYHFSPSDFILHQLRQGDYRPELSVASGRDPHIAASAATLIFTAIFWRGAWKYRARSYRYCLWDNGTILAGLLATASVSGLQARVVAGFMDTRVNRLLGTQEDREASLCLVPIGKAPEAKLPSPHQDPAPLPPTGLEPYEPKVDYPEIQRLHAASSLNSPEEVADWKGTSALEHPQGDGPIHLLESSGGNTLASGSLAHAILERGSTRRFARSPVAFDQLSVILDRSTRGIQADFLGRYGTSLLDHYIIVNAVDGLPKGAYFFSPHRGGLELIKAGDFREEAGHLCFEQALGADAAAVVFFLADLERVLGRYGNRGYRAAYLEAGILAGKTYLCAHSLGIGACGTTFYDDDVAEFFSPHAAGKSVVFLVTLGVADPRNRVKPFRSRVAVVLDALARGATKREV